MAVLAGYTSSLRVRAEGREGVRGNYSEPFLLCHDIADPHVRKRRQRFKKNRKRNYTEGWVEFADKRVAKATAMVLNNTQIGGKKRYYYHDDIWNMKYLPKFHWSHLTERIG